MPRAGSFRSGRRTCESACFHGREARVVSSGLGSLARASDRVSVCRPERVSVARGASGVTPTSSRTGDSDCSRRARPDLADAPRTRTSDTSSPARAGGREATSPARTTAPASWSRWSSTAGACAPRVIGPGAAAAWNRGSGRRVPRACVRVTHVPHHAPPSMHACCHARHAARARGPPRTGAAASTASRVSPRLWRVSSPRSRAVAGRLVRSSVRPSVARRRMVKPASRRQASRRWSRDVVGTSSGGLLAESPTDASTRGLPSAKLRPGCRSLHGSDPPRQHLLAIRRSDIERFDRGTTPVREARASWTRRSFPGVCCLTTCQTTGSDLYRGCLPRLRGVFRFSRPLDASLRL